MSIENYPEINTLPQFDRLVPPADPVEMEYLRAELTNHPESRKIRTWHGNHLVDKIRYDCCKSLNLPVQVEEVFFDDWLHAAIHICTNELKNPHITEEYKKYLIGQSFRYNVMLAEKDKNRIAKSIVAAKLANDLCISAGTVLKYGSYSSAINTILDLNEVFGMRILLGEIRVSHENIIEISLFKPEEIKSLAQIALKDNMDHLSLSYIRNEIKWSHIQTQSHLSRREREEKKLSQRPTIRQMPAYDPDSEVNSLCMTIDSWISSIQRVSNSDNFTKITSKASLQLMKKLSFLEHTVNSVQEMLVERTNP